MAIRSILLHLDAGPGSATRLTLAHGLADRLRAEVTVLFGTGAESVPPAFAYSAAAALAAAQEREGPHDIERARLQARHGERNGIWCEASGDLVQAVVAEAAYADLLVVGPPAGDDDTGAAPSGLVESVILRSGTPALVVPHPHRLESVGEQVLIAWDGSIAAARAVRAALPILGRAERVDVVSWSRPPALAPFSRLGLARYLKRHGIDAGTEQREATSHVGDAVLAAALARHADLIVMGCYGHRPLRERLFGGATRSVLAKLPVPLLMAH